MKQILSIAILFSLNIFYGQDNDDKINKIADDACQCISKIDLKLDHDEKSKEIKTCISDAIMSAQLQEKLLGLVNQTKDTLNKVDDISKIDTLTIGGDINIVLNDEENYEEIETYLYDNCPAMKDVYFTVNKTHENSFSDHKKALKFYNEGQVAFGKEEYLKAITLFNKAVKNDESFAFAWDNLGYSYRKIGNYEMAITCYKKSLELDPRGEMPLQNLPVAYELNNDIDGAISAYEKFAEVYEDNPEAPYGLGRMYIQREEYDKALENMFKAYLLYDEMNSPYKIDAQKNIQIIFDALKKQDKLDLFYDIAKKYNIEVNRKD